nr:FtsK/SpoIIIE domain-containing protein [Mycobacterium sp.]
MAPTPPPPVNFYKPPAPHPAPTVSAADSATAQSLEMELRTRLAGLRAESDRIAAGIAQHSGQDIRQLDADISAQQRDIMARKERAQYAADEQRQRDERTASDTVAAAVEAIAPGGASLVWSQAWSSVPPRPATHVRFGETAFGPAVAPFLEGRSWALYGDEQSAVDLMQQTILRVTAQLPLRFLRVRVFDPRIEGPLGVLTDLRDAHPDSYPAPAHSTSDLSAALAEITALASTAAEQISSRHASGLGELWVEEGRPVHPYTVLAVYSYPLGIDEVTQAALVRLAQSGSPRGVSLLVQVDESVAHPRDVRPRELLDLLTPFTATGGRWRTPLLPAALEIRSDPPPSREQIKAVLARATSEVSSDTGPTINLGELLAGYAADPWRDTVDDGIEAIIGLRGREPVRLALRSENPPHPNLLIGGAVGQGKSNLLLTIIYSLAARYAPDELEMLLLDFKQGLEFKRFDKDDDGRNWLPHARVLSLESSKPFGLAVLEFVQQEMECRAQLFNAARCNGFREYRQQTGQPMSRMLLIIDEFQVLFDGNDDLTTSAVLLFEQLARQGRAFGIHILLSSQTLSGISGLQVKGDSIFAQFPLRVSLKNTAEESQAILSRGNSAAAELMYRGEVVVNRNYGMASANEVAVAGYADPKWIGGLQEQLWERHSHGTEPWVFLGRGFAQWPGRLPDTDVPTARIGRPIAITDEMIDIPFHDDIDQAVALVGTGDAEATAVLGAAVVTATAGWQAGSCVIVLDGRPEPAADRRDPLLGDALDRVRGRGVDVQVVRGSAVPTYLTGELAARLRTNTAPTLLLAVQLQRIAEIDNEVPADADNDDGFGPRVSGSSVLRDLTIQGSARNLHLIGWWPNLRALKAHLSFEHGVTRYVFLKVGLDDLREVVGPQAQPAEGSPRVLLFDRGSDRGAQVAVPFDPQGLRVP